MTVYVDPLVNYSGREWCHMATDGDLDELHEMAKAIRLKRSWFQDERNQGRPHYDLTATKRVAAIRNGAVAVDHGTLFRNCFQFKRLE